MPQNLEMPPKVRRRRGDTRNYRNLPPTIDDAESAALESSGPDEQEFDDVITLSLIKCYFYERHRPYVEPKKEDVLNRIEFGRVFYRLIEPLVGEYQPGKRGIAFRVDEFLPTVVGEGTDRRSALRDFQRKVHTRLQRLLATFEGAWTDEERRDWEILESHLDLEAYLRDRPIKLYQRGEVIDDDNDRWKVRWLDGREETLDLGQMPDDFAAFEAGDHYEAFVAIQPGTKKLVEMYSVRPIEPPDESVSPEEAWQRAIETAERVRLPHSTLDWTQ